MTVNACYSLMNGDYEGVKGRLIEDDRIRRYLFKFKNSTDYAELLEALENKDYEIAFRMSHNLKGVSLNLGLTNLQKVSQELCETIRHGEPATDISGLVTKVTEEYNKVVDAISKL